MTDIKCNVCEITFSRNYNLRRHLCRGCCKPPTIDLLKKRNSIIEYDKPKVDFQCLYCNKKFDRKNKLDRHLLSNRGECHKIRNKKQIINNIQNQPIIDFKKPKRKKINQNTRIQIAARQLWKCNHCEMLFNEGGWDINHILRVAMGGTNQLSNLEALCKNCHGVVTANERIRDGF